MSAKKPDLVLTRVIDAPRERVWKAWTEPQQFAKWWGPHDFTCPVCEIDVRPGGKIYLHMKGPDGSPFSEPMPMGGEFLEVVCYRPVAALGPHHNPVTASLHFCYSRATCSYSRASASPYQF